MKNIGKIKAIVISAIISLVLVVSLILTFVPMELGNKDFESVIGSMNLSRDVSKGISAEYTIDGEYTDKEIQKAIKQMAEISSEYGFKSVSVYKKGDNKIRLDVNSTVLETEKASAEEFLNNLAVGKLEFKSENKKDAVATPENGIIIIDAGLHIKSVEKINYRSSAGLTISFNKEGKALYSAATGSPLYMFVGGAEWPSSNQNEISANNDPSSTEMVLMFNSAEVVDTYYYIFRAGMLPISLDSENVEIVYTTNKTANIARIVLFVLALVIMVAMITYLIVRFKGFGISASVMMIVALALELFLLQAMNWVVIGKSAIIAIIFMLIVNYAVITNIFNKIRDEYKKGKSLETATEDGFNKSVKLPLYMYGVILIVGLVLAFTMGAEFQAIGTIFALSAVLFAVSNLVLTKLVLSVIYSLNNSPKMFGLEEREG